LRGLEEEELQVGFEGIYRIYDKVKNFPTSFLPKKNQAL
jgi:hypothetical protein